MITFKRVNSNVVIDIKDGILPREDTVFSLTISQAYNYQAELLKNQLQKQLNDHIKQIKEAAYNDGWKDAKAKRRKKTWEDFWGGWK